MVLTSWVLNRLHIFTPTVYRTRRGREEGGGRGGGGLEMVIKMFLVLNRVAKLYGFCHKQGRGSWCQRQTPAQLSLKYHPEDFTS